MTEDELLASYGTRPVEHMLGDIRRLLDREIKQGELADIDVAKLLCVQLFSAGALDDVLRIWEAKELSFDAHCSIDVQLLCGAGVEATCDYLASLTGTDAEHALAYVMECVEAGDFHEFDAAAQSEWYDGYYNGWT